MIVLYIDNRSILSICNSYKWIKPALPNDLFLFILKQNIYYKGTGSNDRNNVFEKSGSFKIENGKIKFKVAWNSWLIILKLLISTLRASETYSPYIEVTLTS